MWCHKIDSAYRRNALLFEERLWKYYHATMNNPYFTFFAKPPQRWCSVIILTSRRRYELDVAVTTLYRRLYCNIHNILQEDLLSSVEATLVKRETHVALLTFWRRWEFNVPISTLRHRCQYNILVHTKLNLQSNIEARSEQRRNLDVVVSQRGCNISYWL